MRRRSFLIATAVLLAFAATARTEASPEPSPRVQLVPTGIVVPSHTAGPATSAACEPGSVGRVSCLQPSQLRAAYDLDPLYAKGIDGKGITVVIVDAFGSPTIAQDLRTFDREFSIPAPPSLKVITPTGKIPAYAPGGKDRYGWAAETSLDVEWLHALAPGASILLVETPTDEVEGTSGFPDIVRAENHVIADHLGEVISQSFTATEQTFSSYRLLSPLRSAFIAARKAGVTEIAGSGDLGATDFESNAESIYPYRVTSWPASDPLVTAVGGTKLDLSKDGKQLAPASAWNDTYSYTPPYPSATGGGKSVFFSRPSYQDGVASVTGAHRGVPDVAMSAACSASVDVYIGVRGPGAAAGWQTMCGTSEATPLFASIVALADQVAGHSLGLINPALYALASKPDSGLVPVTSGNNTVAFESSGSKKVTTVVGFDARSSYNLVTGLGTIDAATFVPALVAEVAKLDGR